MPASRLMPDYLDDLLDEIGVPPGELDLQRIGDGHSNLTFLLRRGGDRLVLRRPPQGPLPPSAHDVVREARLIDALGNLGARVPEIYHVCADPDLIGAPFYLMSFVSGSVLTDSLPAALDEDQARRWIGAEMVAVLAEIHAIDAGAEELESFGRPEAFLARQLRRFRGLLEHNTTRPLPDLDRLTDWLLANVPETQRVTVVHGDYRIGNLVFESRPRRLAAVLDWELATLGDPLADLGYLTATWSQAGDAPNVVRDLCPVTRRSGFPTREEITDDYAEATGLAVDSLPWYQALALWRSAIFLEGSYRRYRLGATDDAFFAGLEDGVPALARLGYELGNGG
jgi:aminoglycoside phosphotransferase (APT) family kinase protein